MKDIIITKNQIKKELIIWLCSLGLAFIINLYAIFKYDTPWIELLTQLHVVLLLSILVFIVIGVVRIVIAYLKLILKSRQK